MEIWKLEKKKKNHYLVINDSKERCPVSCLESDYQRKDLARHSGSSVTTARAGEMSCGAPAEERSEGEEGKEEKKERRKKSNSASMFLLMLGCITVE